MKNIAVFPIDNRPVCYDLLKMIASLDKTNCVFTPDISLLGDLKNRANVEALFSWFEKIESVDIVVVSLDTIAYGGLVSSRRCNDDIDEIKNRINRFFDIVKKKSAKVYAFSSIMRISNNNVNEEEKEYWKDYGQKIFEYSYNLHKLGLSKNELISDIPQDILEDYFSTRERNFEINKYYIEIKKQGLIDTLVFSKDDCAEYGLNVKEANELSILSADEKNILVKTGADEIPLSLLSRALNDDKKIKVAPIYTNWESVDKISKYEDISVKESVESQIEICGGVVSDYENCDLVLLVNNFKNQQGELVMNVFEPLFEDDLPLIDKPFFVADILNANGADNKFIEKLLNKSFDNFYGYAGWNTTGNTLGSVISASLTYFNALDRDKEKFDNLQIIRFLDDWAYQANVRAEIRNDNANLQNDVIAIKMKKFEDIILDKFNRNNAKFKYSYPWNRFFEIRIDF